MSGISNDVFDNQASYIDGCLSKLKNDPGVLIRAAVQARNAVNYLISGNKYIPI